MYFPLTSISQRFCSTVSQNRDTWLTMVAVHTQYTIEMAFKFVVTQVSSQTLAVHCSLKGQTKYPVCLPAKMNIQLLQKVTFLVVVFLPVYLVHHYNQ